MIPILEPTGAPTATPLDGQIIADPFLAEVRKIHRIRHLIADLSPAEQKKFAQAFPSGAASWVFKARDAQLPPADLGFFWLFMAGRGAGKSEAMARAAHIAVKAGIRRMHIIAPTAADIRDVIVEGPSGLLATAPAGMVPTHIASLRKVLWPNGAYALTFSGEEPESLRGPQCEFCIIDELARMNRQQAVFDMAMLGCRLGVSPRMLISTTPKPTKTMRALVAMDDIRLTTGSTYDNAAHLAPAFLKKVTDLYEGTKLGLQELQGLLITDIENALFKDDWIEIDAVDEELIEQVSVGVDPSGGGDAIGIVVVARLTDGRYAVLADRTCRGSPAHWGAEVIRCHDEFEADDVVVETNFGGDMCIDVVRQAADRAAGEGKRANNFVRIKEVSASRGKVMRAEPVSLLYEKRRVLHRPGLDLLEAEMLNFSRDWDRARDGSPNRLDAAVWAMTRLSNLVMDIPVA